MCGSNIASTVKCDDVTEYAKTLPNVVYAHTFKYSCSKPSQKKIQEDIAEHNLNRIVVSSCSPRMHEETFRKTVQNAGLNKYLFEMANIREQVSWVTDNIEKATEKAKDLIKTIESRGTLKNTLFVIKGTITNLEERRFFDEKTPQIEYLSDKDKNEIYDSLKKRLREISDTPQNALEHEFYGYPQPY